MNFDLSALDKLPAKKSGCRPSRFAPSARARPVSSLGLAWELHHLMWHALLSPLMWDE